MAVETKRLPRQFKAEAIRIMRSPGCQRVLADRAQRIQRVAGEGHETSAYMRRDRASASVITVSFRARYAQAKYRKLTRSIDAARG